MSLCTKCGNPILWPSLTPNVCLACQEIQRAVAMETVLDATYGALKAPAKPAWNLPDYCRTFVAAVDLNGDAANVAAEYTRVCSANGVSPAEQTQAWSDVLEALRQRIESEYLAVALTSQTLKAGFAKPPMNLAERCNVEYDDKAHGEEWRNQCARDLNEILFFAALSLESGTEGENRFAEAALRIVERVAEFEQITEVDEKLDAEDKLQVEPHHAGDDENVR